MYRTNGAIESRKVCEMRDRGSLRESEGNRHKEGQPVSASRVENGEPWEVTGPTGGAMT